MQLGYDEYKSDQLAWVKFNVPENDDIVYAAYIFGALVAFNIKHKEQEDRASLVDQTLEAVRTRKNHMNRT